MAGNGKLKRRRDQTADAVVPSEGAEQASQSHDGPEQPEKSEPAAKKPRVDQSRSLFIRSLPQSATAESLTDFFSQHFPVKHATVITDPKTKASRGYGFVTFTDADDAKEAKEKLNHHKLDGRLITLEVAEPRTRKPTVASAQATVVKEQRHAALAEARKAPKLIVRNLPWSIKTSDQLSALFRSFGKVKFADLPQSKGKLSGFGFVTLRGRKNAEQALESVNGKTVDGRTLAVDWAVGKEEWDKQQQLEQADDAVDAGGSAKVPSAASPSPDDDDKKDDDDEEEEDEDLRNFMKNHMENLEDEDDEDDDEEDQDDEEDGDEDLELEAVSPPKKLMASNNTTLFVRNLPFSATDASLQAHFEQFGRIRYARVVMDRATDRPAGTGFVCFVSETDSMACLKAAPRPRPAEASGKRSILQDEMADEKGLYTLEGRILQLSQAVSKEEASRLAESGAAVRDGKDKDKRRLYLLSEGTIPASSPLHAALAPPEVIMRDQSAAQRKKLIQGNPSLHLSLTRLAIRNIPRGITSKELKALAREAVVGFATDVKAGRRQPLSKEEATRGGAEDKDAEHKRKEKKKGVVKQTKIVFENKEGSKVAEDDGAGRSRGYGFIEYSSHRWALMGLRWLNGHPVQNAAGKSQRLIVEFAIENAQVVARRREQRGKFLQWGQAKLENDKIVADRGGSANRQGTRGDGNRRDGNRRDRNKRDAKFKDKRPDKRASAVEVHQQQPEGEKSAVRNELEQKIIGRKRTMRKKKATARRG